jgi:hypothetical protein
VLAALRFGTGDEGVPGSIELGGLTMPDQHRWEFETFGNGPRYDYSAAAAAEILNLHFDPSQLKAVLFSRILFTILNAMYLAEAELAGAQREPSDN